jgi:heat shock protein HslJ
MGHLILAKASRPAGERTSYVAAAADLAVLLRLWRKATCAGLHPSLCLNIRPCSSTLLKPSNWVEGTNHLVRASYNYAGQKVGAQTDLLGQTMPTVTKHKEIIAMRYVISLLLLPILFLIGCTADTTGGDTSSPDAAQLQANSWLLLELNGQPPVPGTEVTLNFDDEAIGGNSGCNVYGGSYELVDGRLTISDIFSTMMACLEDGVMEQEAVFHQALRDAATVTVSADGQTLELRNAENVVVALLTATDETDTSETAETVLELQKAWRLVELNGQAPLAGSEITLAFRSETLGGNAGCNSYGATYTTAAGRLTIGELVAHEVYCMADGVLEQEEAYLTTIRAAVSFEIDEDGHTLWLHDAEGRATLSFTAADTANGGL